MLDSLYEWDEEKVIGKLTKQLEKTFHQVDIDYIIVWCEENIPSDLDFV